MRILTKAEFERHKPEFYHSIKQGAVFIYPTDTIYGIGCNAEIKESVDKIRTLKQRKDNPFSVIAPSKQWIITNADISQKGEEWIDKLPGPYTLIVNIKKKCVAPNVSPHKKTLGVRMPHHWFLDHAMTLGIPLVSTSVNKQGEEYMTSLDDVDDDIKKNVDFIIYEGEKQGKPSTLVDLSDTFKIIKR